MKEFLYFQLHRHVGLRLFGLGVVQRAVEVAWKPQRLGQCEYFVIQSLCPHNSKRNYFVDSKVTGANLLRAGWCKSLESAKSSRHHYEVPQARRLLQERTSRYASVPGRNSNQRQSREIALLQRTDPDARQLPRQRVQAQNLAATHNGLRVWRCGFGGAGADVQARATSRRS